MTHSESPALTPPFRQLPERYAVLARPTPALATKSEGDAQDRWVRDSPWIVVDGGTVAAAGSGALPEAFSSLPTWRPAGVVLPGFVDQHVHGAAGADFSTASATDIARAVETLQRGGTTSMLASIATGRPEDTLQAIARLSTAVDAGDIVGLHLEGPWIARSRRGAHAADLLRDPDRAEIDHVLEAAGGRLRMVTIAPELPGALDAIDRFVAAGVVVAIGHTDADAATVESAIDHGASVVTHVFNAMPPLHHRAPGPVGVALTDTRLTLECIVDGQHLDDRVVELLRRTAGGRLTLVSDAMAATGLTDGRYEIAGSAVTVSGGVARTDADGALAGSTTPLSGAVMRLRAGGASFTEIARASSGTASFTLGLDAPLSDGAPADFVVVDPATAEVRATVRRGKLVSRADAASPTYPSEIAGIE